MVRKAAADIGTVFGERLRQSRKARGWHQQDLAERCSQVGHAVDRSVLSRIERGERQVTISEALTLIAALDVEPSYLLSPLDSDRAVRFAKRSQAPVFTGGQIVAWFHGDAALPGTDSDRYLWGAGPSGRNTVSSDLRWLVKIAESTDSAAELIEVLEAGIARLQGQLPSVRLAAKREG